MTTASTVGSPTIRWSDLFSLGATLYYALTKRQPYAARNFDQLRDAWRSSPLGPSKVVPGVPAALDDLFLDLLRIDPGSRPKSAAEVMERLLPLLPARPHDELRAARAYLSTPKLVGREQIISQLRKQMLGAINGRGGGFVVVGDEGSGRSRILDAVVLEAKLLGAVAVRAGYGDAGRPFGVAASIATQIHRAAPALAVSSAAADGKSAALLYPGMAGAAAIADVTRPGLDRAELQAALRSWILEFTKRRPLVLAVDDLDRIDEPSAALLASLSWEAPSRRLVYAAAISDQRTTANEVAISIIRKHAEQITLTPLGEQEVATLLASLFGSVPNVAVLAARVATLSGGRPRECMRFARAPRRRGRDRIRGRQLDHPRAHPGRYAAREPRRGVHASRRAAHTGITGLYLASSYEVLAHIAVARQDKAAFERALSLAGELYQPAKSSALRARYEKLVDKGRKAGLVETAAPTPLVQTEGIARATPEFTHVLSTCETANERADRALALLCDGDPPTRGHLFLFTANGLVLAASNTACDSVTELAAFAKNCVERERAADTMETGALYATSLGTMAGGWLDRNGTCYGSERRTQSALHFVAVSAQVGMVRILTIPFLSGDNYSSTQLNPVVELSEKIHGDAPASARRAPACSLAGWRARSTRRPHSAPVRPRHERSERLPERSVTRMNSCRPVRAQRANRSRPRHERSGGCRSGASPG